MKRIYCQQENITTKIQGFWRLTGVEQAEETSAFPPVNIFGTVVPKATSIIARNR